MTEVRPWGSYTVLIDEPDHKVKTITVKAGHKLSLQRHTKRGEHWVIVRGKARVVNGPNTHESLGYGRSVYIPPTYVHRIEALDEDVVFIEIQTGTYFGEDDIERLEDDYGRIS